MEARIERDGNQLMVMRGDSEIVCYCGDASIEEVHEYATEIKNALTLAADREVIVAAVYALGWWLTEGLPNGEKVADKCYNALDKLGVNFGGAASGPYLERLKKLAEYVGVKL